MQLTGIPLKKEYLILELQNDDIYELVMDNSYFIFIGNDSFNEEIDYFRGLNVQQPFRACLETHLSIMKRFNSMLAMAI